jgi:hypothetical protein
MFDSDDFTETGIFGKRGITREVAEGAFYRYELVTDEESVKAFSKTWDEANPTIWNYLVALCNYADDHLDEPGVWDELWSLFKRLTSAAVRDMTLATRSRGVMMRRFEVPEASDPFILAEMRPDKAIATNLTHYGLNSSVREHRHGPKADYEYEGMGEDERRTATRAGMDDYSLVGGDGRSGHLYKDKITAEAVRAGVTSAEFTKLELCWAGT